MIKLHTANIGPDRFWVRYPREDRMNVSWLKKEVKEVDGSKDVGM
jgi:hypothetical protein